MKLKKSNLAACFLIIVSGIMFYLNGNYGFYGLLGYTILLTILYKIFTKKFPFEIIEYDLETAVIQSFIYFNKIKRMTQINEFYVVYYNQFGDFEVCDTLEEALNYPGQLFHVNNNTVVFKGIIFSKGGPVRGENITLHDDWLYKLNRRLAKKNHA